MSISFVSQLFLPAVSHGVSMAFLGLPGVQSPGSSTDPPWAQSRRPGKQPGSLSPKHPTRYIESHTSWDTSRYTADSESHEIFEGKEIINRKTSHLLWENQQFLGGDHHSSGAYINFGILNWFLQQIEPEGPDQQRSHLPAGSCWRVANLRYYEIKNVSIIISFQSSKHSIIFKVSTEAPELHLLRPAETQRVATSKGEPSSVSVLKSSSRRRYR